MNLSDVDVKKSMKHSLVMLNRESNAIGDILESLNSAEKFLFIILLKELVTSYYEAHLRQINKSMDKERTDKFVELVKEIYQRSIVEVEETVGER